LHATPKAAQPKAAPPTKATKAYDPRHPERTLLYRTIAEHFETWLKLANAGQFDGVTTIPRHPTQIRRFANTWSAASLPTALRGHGVTTAVTTF